MLGGWGEDPSAPIEQEDDSEQVVRETMNDILMYDEEEDEDVFNARTYGSWYLKIALILAFY